MTTATRRDATSARPQFIAERGPLVALHMDAVEGRRLAEWLVDHRPTTQAKRVREALWLRTVLLEQRRRTALDERAAFDRRATRALLALQHLPGLHADEPVVCSK
jgi:hypothetical protein